LSNSQRYAVLQVVWEHLSTVPELTGTFFPISGTEKYRIYFREDESFLWCNEWGKLYAGIKKGDRKTCRAQQVMDTYGLNV
jgi:hypothetical protein